MFYPSALAIRASRQASKENRKASSGHRDHNHDGVTSGTDSPATVVRLETGMNIPFVIAYDIPRGALFALQVLLGYLLMLAVMYLPCAICTECRSDNPHRTFQAAYIISIIFGLGIGETLFARVGGSRGH
jgi:hypothetical protein